MQRRRGLRVGVVGGGFAGIGAARELRRAGHDVTVFEAADHVGGTWYHNRYPGCCCDIPSVLYSFSFAPNPDWSHHYPPQPEIRRYLEDVVDRFGLRSSIRTGARVTAARFEEPTATWCLEVDGVGEVEVDAVVAATGPLSRPRVPDLPGLETFSGRWFHTGDWPADLDLAGSRVALVGTGASAIQVGPAIVGAVDHLTVLQRSAPWIVPRVDGPVPARRRRLRGATPGLLRAERWLVYWGQESVVPAFLGIAPWQRRAIRRLATAHLHDQVVDPALRAAVTPDYEPGCKRLLLSDDWYPTLVRDDVTLVPEAACEVTTTGVVSESGRRVDVDTVIFGTGFDVSTSLAPMAVTGLGGRDLDETWAEGATTHLGITVPGFPNLFVLAGPNTGLGHNSIVFMIEAQLHYVVGALAASARRGRALEIDPLAARRSYERVQERMDRTVWASGGCSSWYQNRAGGGIDAMWPGTTVDYWRRTRRFDPGRYRHVPARG